MSRPDQGSVGGRQATMSQGKRSMNDSQIDHMSQSAFSGKTGEKEAMELSQTLDGNRTGISKKL